MYLVFKSNTAHLKLIARQNVSWPATIIVETSHSGEYSLRIAADANFIEDSNGEVRKIKACYGR